MRISYVTILLFCFFSSTAWCQICADSSYHLRYSFPDRLDARSQILLKDSGRLVQGGIQGLTTECLITRFGKNNDVRWSKRYSAGSAYVGVGLRSIEEAANGNLALCGFLQNSSSQFDLFIAFLNSSGNLIAQKIINPTIIANYKNRYNQNDLVCKKGSDSVLFMAGIDWDGSDPQKLCLITTDNMGNLGSNKIIDLPNTSYSIDFSIMKVSGSRLSLYGSANHNNSCSFFNNTGSFVNIEIDLFTNQVISKKTFCLPTAGGTGPVGLSSSYQPPGPYDFHGWRHNGFILKNGGIALTRAYQRFTITSDTTNWLFLISYFDSSFNPIQSEYVTTGNLFLKTIQEVLIDSLRNKYFYFTEPSTSGIYYALADSLNNFKLQKKVSSPLFGTSTNENRMNIFSPDALLSITSISYSASNSQIDYFSLLQKDTGVACFGTDTSFLFFRPAQLTLGSWGTITVQPTSFSRTPLNLSSQDYSIGKEVICIKRRLCDILKLHAPDTVCDLSQAITVTATKNPDCEGRILFAFDTSQVSSYSQPDDTTLILSFNKSWNGKVYATASSCPSLKDSLTLNVLAPMPELDLGNDTVLCKGATLQLSPSTGFKSYLWKDGSTTNSFMITSPGKYYLTATDYCGRQYSDTINVAYSTSSINAGPDIAICLGEEIHLSTTSGFLNYSWQPNYNITNAASSAPAIFPYRTTDYIVQAKDIYNCPVSDTVTIRVDTCEAKFFVPSAFTPNGDGNNDMFKPIIKGLLVKYQFSIYNRWGQAVYFTNKASNGWNGEVSGKKQATGIYVWICSYQFLNGPILQTKGTVLLIR